jgi:hypothetical protein
MKNERVLFRFVPNKYLHDILQGKLYMNALSYFSELEAEDMARSDDREGQSFWLPQGTIISIRGNQGFIPIAGVTHIAHTIEGALKQNIFCLYALPCAVNAELVDRRNLEFGDTFIRFTQPDEFLRRVRKAAEGMGQEFCAGLVRYVAETYDGPVGPFRKRLLFSYQNEFRIVLKPGTGGPLVLDIGDIRDITVHGLISGLNREIENQWVAPDHN